MDGFTDIRAGGWVRLLPRRWIPYAILARFDRPVGAWLLFLPGLWAICLAAGGFWLGVWLTVLFGVGSVVMRGAGCVVNDLWDRDMDRLVTRTAGRPLASGILKPIDAMAFLALLLALGLLILVQLDNIARWLGVISLLPVALYPLAKRVTWWPQIVLGFTFGWGALQGYAAAAGALHWPVVPLYAAAIFWILGYDTIYAHQDREDDALIGVKSTARLFGANTKPFLLVCYGAMMLLLAVAMAMSKASVFGIAALLLPAALLLRQILLLDINNPELCLKLFKSNREVGLAVAAAILIGQVF
ncbi:MAG: 4-hydroxybenzoate octaprenyltransferase [Acidocella sp.]|nr:4-hydroxybenzoate octaprenyltransferase [Acidocella sp.]